MIQIQLVFLRFHHGVPDQSQKLQVTLEPITLTFRHLQNRSQIQVWLCEHVNV